MDGYREVPMANHDMAAMSRRKSAQALNSFRAIKRSGHGGVVNREPVYFRSMCRNIKTLANFEPPATGDEIRASALQFVRKLTGMNKPSRANEPAFNRAVDEVTEAAQRLIASISTNAPPRNREEEARKAQERARERFA
jgi:hypothetical protein